MEYIRSPLSSVGIPNFAPVLESADFSSTLHGHLICLALCCFTLKSNTDKISKT